LVKSLISEGFIVEEFTSAITPPKSLARTIDEKNAAIQAALKAENQVKEAEANAKIKIAQAKGQAEALKISADAEAYANKKVAASLTPLLAQKMFLEKWNGELPKTIAGKDNMVLFPTN
jgi:regulator of protease activity HflC (stomatin/prohibitin superfamily)